MSTAVMPQSATYDFGDMFKSVPGNQGPEPIGSVGNHLAVGAPPLSPRRLRFALSRMSSSPATATATLVTSLLDNLSTHHRRLERTQSAPAPVIPSASTELCRPYEEFGVCKYGDKCQFAHGLSELRSLARHPKYKTELCRTYHTVGFCPYGPRCHFVHNEEEARQHNRAVAALLAGRGPGGLAHNNNNGATATSIPIIAASAAQPRARPSALSPSLSLDSPSPASSLSQSPTSSMGSFFSSESELHSPTANALQHNDIITIGAGTTGVPAGGAVCPPSPSSETAEFRLPVFNRLSASVLALGDLML
ncbi:Tis11 zinc finger protein [Carabus blaptoides fortunei]